MSASSNTIQTATASSSSSLFRGVFGGSGSDGMNDARLATCILELHKNSEAISSDKKPRVLYLGTATYDLPQFAKQQTERFVEQECEIQTLNVVDKKVNERMLRDSLEWADVLVVGGGNTLFAMDRWQTVGLVPLLQDKAMKGDLICTGGSAGAICWFEAGHSDSMDLDTYQPAMMRRYDDTSSEGDVVIDESAPSSTKDDVKKEWKYIRIPGLAFLPGFLCPHHDRIQSNGVLRAHDFDQMMLRESEDSEVGIGIDHWAALIVDGDSFRVLSLEDKPGSVACNADDGTPSFSGDASGKPGIWIKRVVVDENGGKKVQATLCPPSGMLSEILPRRRPPHQHNTTSMNVEDAESLARCRRENPDTGPPPPE